LSLFFRKSNTPPLVVSSSSPASFSSSRRPLACTYLFLLRFLSLRFQRAGCVCFVLFCFVCLAPWDLPNHGTSCCVFGTVGKPSIRAGHRARVTQHPPMHPLEKTCFGFSSGWILTQPLLGSRWSYGKNRIRIYFSYLFFLFLFPFF
jgi:hypothetical protein